MVLWPHESKPMITANFKFLNAKQTELLFSTLLNGILEVA